MSQGGRVFVELCAGSAAVSLRLLSSRAKPPIGYQGGKRGYAGAILQAMGLAPGQGGREGWDVLLVEPGPWGEAWQLWRTAEGRRDTCERLRAWAGEDPRELWERLRAAPVPVDAAERVAVWAVLQHSSFGNKPVLMAGGKWDHHGLDTGYASGEAYKISLASVVDLFASLLDLSRVQVHQDCAQGVAAAVALAVFFSAGCASLTDTWVYIDPPYLDTTGYGSVFPRADVLATAEAMHAAGAHVAVSEAEPLPLPGWHTHRLPRAHGVVRSWSAQQSEYLTLSREPRGQLSLLGPP